MDLEEAPTDALPSDVKGIIGRAWPDGLQGQNLVDWHMLAPVAQDRAVRRLAALLRLLNPADDEEPFETTADAAKAAGMGLSTFYSMMKRWKDSPSLSSLGVHAKTPVSRRTARGDEREAAEKFLCSELTKDSGLGTLELVRRMNDAGYAMPKSSAVRLIGIARREVSAAAPFGGRFAIDSAGMDMIDSSGDRMRIWATLHPASGLILGWLIETEGSGSQTYGLLARKTLNCLPSLSLEGLHATGTAGLEVRMPPSDMVFNHFVHPRMTLLRSPRTVADRQTGGLILRALGDRLAHVWIGQGQRFDGRSYRTGRIEPMPIVSMVLLENISWSIELHNRECIDRMPKDGDSAMLQVTLNALRVKMNEIIGTVDDLEARLRAGRNT